MSKAKQKDAQTAYVKVNSPAEWAVAALGGILLAVMIGYMIYVGATQADGPPEIVLQETGARPAGDAFVVEIVARNRGDSTAAALNISGALMEGDTVVEESKATIDYLPKQSEREAGLYFTKDPARYRLVLRPEGFAAP